MSKKFLSSFWLLLFLFSLGGASAQVRYPSYRGLVMAGYQGWFNTPGDSAGRSWHHYERRGTFAPGSCEIDLWPDTREYKKTYPTAFHYADGQTANVFSPMTLPRSSYILNG